MHRGAGAGATPIVLVLVLLSRACLAAVAPAHDATLGALAGWERAEAKLDAEGPAGAGAAYFDLLQTDGAALAAAEGRALLREASCGGRGAAQAAMGASDTRADSHATHVGVAGARRDALDTHRKADALRCQGKLREAAPRFARASRLAVAAGDRLAGVLYLQAGARCAARTGDAARGAAWAERADSLLAALAASCGDGAVQDPERITVGAALRRLGGDSRLLRAHLANVAGQHAAADTLYRELVATAFAHGWTRLRCDALVGLGSTHSRRRRVDAASGYFHAALELALRLDDRHRQALVLTHLGYEQTQQRALDAAEATLQQALALIDGCGYAFHRGYVLAGLAAAAEARGERPRAAELFSRAVAEHAALGNDAGELGARQWLAYNLVVQGHYVEAIAHYERCLQILDAQDSLVIRNWVLGGLALTYHKLGRLDAAADHYRRSLEVNRRLGNRVNEAWAQRSLGILSTMRGDYRRALVQLEAARALSDSIGDAEGGGEAQVALAHAHLAVGDLERSREHFEGALALAESGRHEELLRRAAAGAASVCREAGRLDEAQRYARRALALARKWSDQSGTLEALADLAELHLDAGRPDSARAMLAACNRLLAERGSLLQGARVALLEARAAPAPALAVERATAALNLAVDSGLPEREWMARHALGRARLALGDTAAAIRCLEGALEVVESQRRGAGSDELRRHMLRPALAPYELLVAIHAAAGGQGGALRALAVTERSRAQILASHLRDARAHAAVGRGPAPEPEDDAAESERTLRARLTFLQARLQDGSLPAAQREELRLEAQERENEARLLRLRLAERDAAYADAAYPVAGEPSSLLAALDPGEVAVSYFLGADASYVFAARRSGVVVRVLPARHVVEEHVRRFLRLRAGAALSAAAAPPSAVLERAGRQLHALLLQPVLAAADSSATLIVVPDGLLHHLPFCALSDGQGMLLGRCALFHAPSLRVLGFLRQREAARRLAVPPRVPIIAVGCDGGAEPSGIAARLHPYDDSAMTFLPSAAVEARQVAKLFSGAILLTGTAAGELSFRSSPLAEAAVLHVAAHGYADERDVRRSFLALNPPDAGAARAVAGERTAASLEDGLLQWDEAAALPLRSTLVTLASCHSAGGMLAAGEGVIGLTQAFLHAGASSVLATLGKVPDACAHRLVLSFYERMLEGDTAAEALRSVQAAARGQIAADQRAAAEFVLVGDGGVRLPLPDRNRGSGTIAGALGALATALIAVGVLISRRRRARAKG